MVGATIKHRIWNWFATKSLKFSKYCLRKMEQETAKMQVKLEKSKNQGVVQ